MHEEDQTKWTGGYKTPPYANRFPKGISGNPAGRKPGPAKVQAVGDRALELLRQPVTMKVPGRTKKQKVPLIDAVIMTAAMKALASDKPMDQMRLLKQVRDLGYDYALEETGARQEERRRYEAELAARDEALKTCHAAIELMGKQVAALERRLSSDGSS